MKTLFRIDSLCALLMGGMLMSGCSENLKETFAEQEVESEESVKEVEKKFILRVSQGKSSDTRMLLTDELELLWEPEDELYLFDKNTNNKITFICDIEEASATAEFYSESVVPSGDYWVVYNINNDQLAFPNRPLTTFDDLNSSKNNNLSLYGELTVESDEISGTVTLNHLYAKVRFDLQNKPTDLSEDITIGMYSKKGMPEYLKLTSEGLKSARTNRYYSSSYETTNETEKNFFFGSVKSSEVDNLNAFILPQQFTGEDVFFYVLDGDNKCYEFKKHLSVDFISGNQYKVKLDFNNAVDSSISIYEDPYPCTNVSSPAEWRHAIFRGGIYVVSILNDIDFYNEDFLPIDDAFVVGGGHKFKNINLDWSDQDNVGIIRKDPSSNISTMCSGLTLENITIKGKNNVGAFCGTALSLYNCSLTGTSTVQGTGDYVGGLIGNTNICYGYSSTFQISNISVVGKNCKIFGKNYVGGYFVSYDDFENSQISGLIFEGEVTATGNNVGGIIGSCYRTTISDCLCKGTVTGKEYVGGISGGISEGGIQNCVSEGNVTGEKFVGGLLGSYSRGTMEKCLSLGNVEATNSYAGGLLGNCEGGIVKNCYSLSTVTSDGISGGLIGYANHSSYIQNCYYAGTKEISGGILGESEIYVLYDPEYYPCAIKNCVTICDNLISNFEGSSTSLDNNVTSATSILDNLSTINKDENAYSSEVWDGYPYEPVKFKSNSDLSITLPGFSSTETVI